MASGLLFGGSQAWAAAPPANAVIGNQATADYLDPNGLPQSATSNLVQTTVQKVGSFNLDGMTSVTSTVQNTKSGAAGQVLYAPHVLLNTGNGSDDFTVTVTVPGPNGAGAFSKVEVFYDMDENSKPDSTTALCSFDPGSQLSCTIPAQTVAGNNGKLGFVVAYSLPNNVASSITPYASAYVSAKPVSNTLYDPSNVEARNVDSINSTTTAAFNVSKSIQQPASGVTAPGGGAWPVATGTGKRSVWPAGSGASNCPVTWTAGMTSSANCQYTVYTLSYSNTGGATGRFNLQDVIGTGGTAGMQYVAGSAVWSNASGIPMGEGSGGDPAGTDFVFDSASKTLTFVDNALPVNTTRSISFVVLVTNAATVGTATTSNVATFNPEDAPLATAIAPVGVTTSVTNTSSFTVTGSYGVVLGAASSTAVTALDSSAGTPLGTTAAGADTTSVTSAAASSFVSFTQTVYNTGNDTDTVNITSANPGTGGTTAFPAGTTFFYYKADGATQLGDTNADGTVDTGPIAAGASTTIVVKARLPGNLVAANNVNYTLTVTGTSTADATKFDATRDVLVSVTGALVDLTNTASGTSAGAGADLGTGPSSAPTTSITTTPGTTSAFALWVRNNDSITNTYSLAVSVNTTFPGSLIAGWTVKFVNGDLSANAAGCAAAAAVTSVQVDANLQGVVTACVTVPSSQVPVANSPLYFQVRSLNPASTGATVMDTKYDALTVTAPTATYTATLTPDNSGQVSNGGSVVYAHTLTNTGSSMCAGPYNVAVTMPAASVTAGWTSAVYLDGNGTTTANGVLDASDIGGNDLEDQRSSPATASPLRPATGPGVIDLERLLPGLDAAPGFLDFKDGDVLPSQSTNVRVKGPVGVTLRLSVNDVAIDGRRVGKKASLASTGAAAWEYIGIILKPGVNRLQLEIVDDFGVVRGTPVTLSVTAPDKLGAIHIDLPASARADLRTPVPVTIRVGNATALTTGLEYLGERLKFAGVLEGRRGSDSNTLLNAMGLSYKLDTDWSLLTRTVYSSSQGTVVTLAEGIALLTPNCRVPVVTVVAPL